jgi:hypothetical protein
VRGRRAAISAAAAALALSTLFGPPIAPAGAERTQRGNVILAMKGGFSPLSLPRRESAPVSVHLETTLSTADRSLPPTVTGIELGMPPQATITTAGLPACPPARLRNVTSSQALEACRPALIGRGRLLSRVKLPHQAPIQVRAGVLAFNGRLGRTRAVILHAGSRNPASAGVLVFRISRASGRFGTRLLARPRAALGPWIHLTHLTLDLSRIYRHRGRKLSYLSARCPIPKRSTAGFFSFARAKFSLAGGREISLGISRSCRAR